MLSDFKPFTDMTHLVTSWGVGTTQGGNFLTVGVPSHSQPNKGPKEAKLGLES